MPTRSHRRAFLKSAGLTALAGMNLALPRALRAADSPLSSDIQEDPRLFVGCCAYSFLKYMESGRMSMEDFIRKGVELGVTGVDVTGYWLKSMDPGYLAGLRHLGFRNEVPFSGAACGVSMVHADAAARAHALEEIKQWVDATERLGASHLRVFAGELPKGATVEQGIRWTVEVMKPACDYSATKGITLGVEDHSGVTQTADVCLEIMRRVDSPYAGINLDISHFIPSPAQDAYAQIEACIPFATHTHIHDVFDDGTPIDFERVWKLFAQGGYKGYMSLEYEGKEDAMTAVPRLLEQTRTLCRKYSTA
jgi:sugar phosphate isomerase/epimerase